MSFPRGELTIDLGAIAHNWELMSSCLSERSRCGAVVKASAYGLGVDRVAKALYQAGCRDYFVANLDEGCELRSLIHDDARIFVLMGCGPGEESIFIDNQLCPVITSLAMLDRWLSFELKDEKNSSSPAAGSVPSGKVAALKLNTGMARLGLDVCEYTDLLTHSPEYMAQAGIILVLSHLACADEPDHPLNQKQLRAFEYCETLWKSNLDLPEVQFSLANSAGALLNHHNHFDLIRPGISLYGGPLDCMSGIGASLRTVVTLRLPIVQIREVCALDYVGYGATYQAKEKRIIATVAGGYADGVLRSLSNRGWGFVDGIKVPLVGRVSMDSCAFDVSECFDNVSSLDHQMVELLGENVSVHELAYAGGTIGYELLTSLGSRYQRIYKTA